MKNILLIIIGTLVLVGLFFLVQSMGEDGPDPADSELPTGNPATTTDNTPEPPQGSDTIRVVAEEGVFPDGLVFTMRAPTGTDVRVENENIYRIIYAGEANEPPALTDGIGMSIQVLESSVDQSLEEFAVDRFTEEDSIIEGTFTSHQAYGREIYTLQVESQLNDMPVRHIYFAIDDTHVAFVTVSLYGSEDAKREYEQYVSDMLTSLTFMQASEDADDLIKVRAPRPGDLVNSPLEVSGRARGQWYFEATFPIVVVDWDGRIIGEGYATAQDEWMTEEFVPFEGTIEYELEEASMVSPRGTVIFQRSNPSGLPENDAAVEVPIEFQ